MADDNEVAVRFGAQTDGFATGVQRAVTEMRKTQAAFKETAADTLALDNALAKYMSRLDPTYRAQKQLADGEMLLNRNLEAGNISAQTHASALARIERAYGSAGEVVERAGGRMSFATAGVSRELIVLGHEAVSGNWTRMPGTMMVLASRTGNLGTIFAALASPIGIATIAIAGFAAAIAYADAKSIQLEQKMQSLRDNMTATGRSGTFTREQFDALVKTLHDVGGLSNKAAGEIVEVFVRAHRIGAPLMQDLTNIVVKYSNATGKDAVDASKELAKAFADPEKGAKALREELGQFLTPAQNALIESQERSGQVAKAQATLFAALRDRLREVSDEAKRTTLSLMMENIGKAGGRIADDTSTGRASEEADEAVEAKRKAAIEARARIEQSAQAKALNGINEALEASGKYIPLDERRNALGEEILRTKNAITAAEKAGIAAEDEGLKKLKGRLAEEKRASSDMKGKGDMGRVQAMEQELNELKNKEQNWFSFSHQQEIDFWSKKLATVRQGSTDYKAIYDKMTEAKKAAAKEDLATDLAAIKEDSAQYKEGSIDRIANAQQTVDLLASKNMQMSSQYRAALQEMATEERKLADRQLQDAETVLQGQLQHVQRLKDIDQDRVNFSAQMGNIDVAQKVAKLKEIETKSYENSLKILNDEQKLRGQGTKEWQDFENKKVQLTDQYGQKIEKLNQETAKALQKKWESFWSPISSAWSSSITALIMKTQTLRQAMVSVETAIVQSFVKMGTEIVSDWIMSTALMKAAKAAMTAFFVSNDQVATASAGTSASAQAAETIPVYAGEGAAGAYDALCSIPYIGPFIAPAAAATAFAGIMSYKSAAGGYEVPADMMLKVHENEMVLPAAISDHIRSSMSAGGSGGSQNSGNTSANQSASGDTHNHYYSISAMDGDSVKKFFKNNRGAMSSQIKTSVRDAGLKLSK